MLTDKIDPTIYNGVSTIGLKDIIPKSIVIVLWSWNDDEDKFT